MAEEKKPKSKYDSGGRKRGSVNKKTLVTRDANFNIKQLAREKTPKAVKMLGQIMEGTLSRREYIDDPEGETNENGKVRRVQKRIREEISLKDRMDAAIKLLEYGHGKPSQALDVKHEPPDLSRLTDKQVQEYYELSCILHGVDPDLTGGTSHRAVAETGSQTEKDNGLKH